MKVSAILLCFFLMNGCSSAEKRVDEYNKIEIGMLKRDVIEVAGPPYWSDRKDGIDRWIYYMVPRYKQSERIVYFRHGKVVRKGLREKPILSAEEMEEIKKPRMKEHHHQPSVSEEELRKLIKKEIQKKEGKKDPELERI